MTAATGRTIFLVAVGLLVLWLAYQARAVVTPLLLSLTLAYILDPIVQTLERRGLSRGVASVAVVLVVMGTLVTAVTVAANQFASEVAGFYDDVVGEACDDAARRGDFEKRLLADVRDEDRPATLAKVRETRWSGRDIVYFDRDGSGTFQPGYSSMVTTKVHSVLADTRWAGPIERGLDGVKQLGPQLAKSANAVLGGLVEGGRSVFAAGFGLLTLAVLCPIYLYYSLVNLSRVYDVTVRHLPSGQRARIVDILHKIHVTLSAFFRGRLITMLVKGLLLLGVFVAFGVPFAYVCAVFGALASLVPIFGGVVAAIPPILLAVPDSSGGEIAGLAAALLAIEGIEGYVLIPALIGRRVGLHPLTVLVCTFVAGDLLGLFGMIVAVPLTAVLKILVAEFVLPEVRRRAGIEPAVAPRAPESPGDGT